MLRWTQRRQVAERTSVAIIGAGIAGIAMAEALLSAGRRDFLLIEAGEAPGGVWRDTRYPGVACDVPSHVFSYSFAGNPGWSRRYAPGSEVNAYLGDVFNGLGLGARTRFGTRVTACAWGSDRWLLRTSDGAVIEADHVVLATGILRDPLWPAFARGTDFAGKVVHSAEWPEALDLTGQRVAVVGSGSSACQIIPNVVREAASCTVYMLSLIHI